MCFDDGDEPANRKPTEPFAIPAEQSTRKTHWHPKLKWARPNVFHLKQIIPYVLRPIRVKKSDRKVPKATRARVYTKCSGVIFIENDAHLSLSIFIMRSYCAIEINFICSLLVIISCGWKNNGSPFLPYIKIFINVNNESENKWTGESEGRNEQTSVKWQSESESESVRWQYEIECNWKSEVFLFFFWQLLNFSCFLSFRIRSTGKDELSTERKWKSIKCLASNDPSYCCFAWYYSYVSEFEIDRAIFECVLPNFFPIW